LPFHNYSEHKQQLTRLQCRRGGWRRTVRSNHGSPTPANAVATMMGSLIAQPFDALGSPLPKAVMTELAATSPTLIVFSGLPGSGKSTLAQGLSIALAVTMFSVDPIEAEMLRAGVARAHTGTAAYEVAQALAGEHLQLGHSVIIDAVNPVEAPRAAWRRLAAKHHAQLKIIECVCADEAIHRQRIEKRVRNIAGLPEVAWTDVLKRRAEYEAWADARLVLETSRASPEQSLSEALAYTSGP